MPTEGVSKPSPAPATRLHFIVARRAPIAVVFRRGPTRQVELLTWNLETDEITPGQWLKGRIYERRCDLSPSGKFLIYFAAKYGTGMRTWTAISRPPYLTALALWPKGDAWGGGGLFDSERRLQLNHGPAERALADGFKLAPSMTVVPFGEHAGAGEDFPIHVARLERDGWTWLDRQSESIDHGFDAKRWVSFDPPIVAMRPIGPKRSGLQIERILEGIRERDGPWYLLTYRITNGDGALVRDLGRADWADAAPNGDLLLASDGRLFRLRLESNEGARGSMVQIGDLRGHRFENRVAAEEFRRW